MEMTSHCRDVTDSGANKNPNESECISSQPTANGTLPHHSTDETPPPLSDCSEDGDISDDSLMNGSSTNDNCRLLPSQSASGLKRQKGVNSSSASPPPICTPPSPSVTSPPPPPPPSPPPSVPPPSSRASTCKTDSSSRPHHHHHHHHHHHPSTNQNRLSSTKSNTSFKSDAVHIKEVAGDDCCVHCVLACLFCEMLSMCSAVGECLACGVGGAGCCCNAAVDCCCCMEAAGGAACTEEACQAVLDCGILENCCGSSDCLEICLECCSICFPS